MPQAPITFPAAVSRTVFVLAHIGFALTGIVTTMLGPLLPALKARWALSDAQAGYLFTAQFAASVVSTMLLTSIIRRLGFLRTLAVSYLLLAAGVAGVGSPSWAVGLMGVSVYGFGLGLAMPATNLLISETSGGRRAAALNILNFVWCIGAVACPLLLMVVVRDNRTAAPMLALAATLIVTGVWLWRSIAAADPRSGGAGVEAYRQASRAVAAVEQAQVVLSAEDRTPREAQAMRRVWRSAFAYVLAALVFLYVGAENSISGWVGAYTKRTNAEMAALYSLPQAAFWAALMTGRLLAPVWLRRLSEERLVILTACVSLLGVSLLLATAQAAGLLAGAVLAGAGFAAIYPTTIATFMKVFGERAAASAAPIFATGGLGGAVLPSLVGAVSDRFSSLRAGLLVPLAVNVAIIILQVVVLAMLLRRRPPRS
ncbi:MAG TPA: MFS transporter [Blastocatellia bacterium]|nr:MFS transporter [Blastocatellia bacterium]